MNSEQSYSIVNNILRSRIVVDIDCDAAQGSYFGRELGEARVVLALALIGVRHGGGLFLKVQIAEESLRGHNSEGPSLPPQLLGSPGCWGREVFRAGGQGTDAPDCVASGYWRTLSPADRKAVCIR